MGCGYKPTREEEQTRVRTKHVWYSMVKEGPAVYILEYNCIMHGAANVLGGRKAGGGRRGRTIVSRS